MARTWIELQSDTKALARLAAAEFAAEFPGETLDPAATDWDGTAWEIDCASLGDLPADTINALWDVYSETLVAETARLAAQRHHDGG